MAGVAAAQQTACSIYSSSAKAVQGQGEMALVISWEICPLIMPDPKQLNVIARTSNSNFG